MKFLPPALTLMLSVLLAGATMAGDKEMSAEYALLAAQLELDSGALDVALDEGADTAFIGSIDVLEYDLGRPLSSEEKKMVIQIFRDALARILTPEVWVETTAKVYSRHLEPNDLRQLTDFYQTDAGSRILAAQAALSRDLGDTAERLLDDNQAEFAEQVDSALAELFPEYGLAEVE